jgi:hypothetical protein
MRKIFTALFLSITLLALPMAAYAKDATSGSMSVVYEYTAPEGGEPGDATTYTVNIPASVSNDNLEVIPITVSENNIPDGKVLFVTVDWDKSYDELGYFNLYKNKGEPNEESIRCRVLAYKDSTLNDLVYVDHIDSVRGDPVAKFLSGSTVPAYGGCIQVLPLTLGAKVSSGAYSNTLHFNIEVKDAE